MLGYNLINPSKFIKVSSKRLRKDTFLSTLSLSSSTLASSPLFSFPLSSTTSTSSPTSLLLKHTYTTSSRQYNKIENNNDKIEKFAASNLDLKQFTINNDKKTTASTTTTATTTLTSTTTSPSSTSSSFSSLLSSLNIFSYILSKENQTIPNYITISRILSSPLLYSMIINDMKSLAFLTSCLFCVSDYYDGYLARKLNQKTHLGSVLDPVADKFFIFSLSLGLYQKDLLPAELLAIILGKDALLLGCCMIIHHKNRQELIKLKNLERKNKEENGEKYEEFKLPNFFDFGAVEFKVIPNYFSKVSSFHFI